MAFDKIKWEEASKFVEDFRNDLLNKNRYFNKHPFLVKFHEYVSKSEIHYNKGHILYRARIYNEGTSFLRHITPIELDDSMTQEEKLYVHFDNHLAKSKKKSGFWGYDADNSFAPPSNDMIPDGRANPSYHKYLYTAEKKRTAIYEVKPGSGQFISVADIELKEDLVIANITYEALFKHFEDDHIIFNLSELFSAPIDNNKDYIITQVLSEYIRVNDFNGVSFDGVRFRSALDSAGCNVTIFNIEKCKVVGSHLYQLKNNYANIMGITLKDTDEYTTGLIEHIKRTGVDEFMERLEEDLEAKKKEEKDPERV